MSLFVASLNSGSNGNCYYVGNETDAVLIDAGISCRETEKRLKRLDLDIHKIRAIFISHEHSDHIQGLCVLAKKYQLPVYITPLTLQESRLALCSTLVRPLSSTIAIGSLRITAFPKLHDAADPHSFVVTCGQVQVGVFTDIGAVCEQVVQHFKTCHAVFLEANYDEEMLENGRYPYFLKRRIRGGKGHISNSEAMKLFLEHRPSHMTHLFLSHLSRDNNDPALVQRIFESVAGATQVIVASRFQETALYAIQSTGHSPLSALSAGSPSIFLLKSHKTQAVDDLHQLSLF